MARYRRRGHWRRGRNGTLHWVSGHEVNRGTRVGLGRFGQVSVPETARTRRDRAPARRARPSEKWTPLPEDPNARCPICFEPVWFFRNERGGCAYFDAIGKPWPLHPCMEHPQTAEDRRAAAEARAAHELALRTSSRFAARHEGRAAVHDAVSRLAAQKARGSSAATREEEPGATRDEPLDWWTVLSGLWALLLSLLVSRWVDAKFEWIPPLLSLWAISVPTLCMALAIGWYLLRAPRPRIDAGDVFASLVMAPILLLLGMVGNLLTCGLGVPVVALWVASEANEARRRGTVGRGRG